MKTVGIPYYLQKVYNKKFVRISENDFYMLKADVKRDRISIGEAWHRRQREHQPTTPIVPRSDDEVVNDALLRYPPDCPDMFSIEGAPTLRQCACPNKDRPISLTRNNGRYIIDNPKICWRCRGLGYRKGKKPSVPTKTTPVVKSDSAYCKRDKEWFFIGNKDCLTKCKWGMSECRVKKELRKPH